MAQPTLAQLISLPLPLEHNDLLRRRQYLRQELNGKIHHLRQIQNRRVFYIKCPCDLDMCNHMDPYTVDLHLDWHPLEAELAYFFINQPWAHLGLYVYPHLHRMQ